jgi:hypothetical protein
LEPIRPYGILLVLLLLAAFPPVRDGFSHLMNSIWSDLSLPPGGPGFGQYNFQFWKHAA